MVILNCFRESDGAGFVAWIQKVIRCGVTSFEIACAMTRDGLGGIQGEMIKIASGDCKLKKRYIMETIMAW